MSAKFAMARNLILGFCFFIFPYTSIQASESAPVFSVFPQDDIYADSARYYLDSFYKILGDMLEIRLDSTVKVYIADSDEEFRRMTDPSIPDWGAGIADIERNIIVIKSPKYTRVGKTFRELIGHELTHIMMNRASGGQWLPRWIHEGMAMHVSGEWNLGQDILVARAAWTKRLIRLQRLESLSEFNGAEANLAYTESYLAVSNLIKKGDKYIIADLLDLYRKNKDFYRSFRMITGMNYIDWIDDWHERTSMQYHFLLFIFDSRIFWMILPLVFILLYLYKRRQSRKVRRRWKVEERLNPPDDQYKQYYDGYYDDQDQI